jgi:uncharacterized protein YcsI (UPF0317 family)
LTSGIALGYVRVDPIFLPNGYASDMLLFTQRDPNLCPLPELMRHVEQDVNAPMHATNRPDSSTGGMHGPLVVSVRPVPADAVAGTAAITALMPADARRSGARQRARCTRIAALDKPGRCAAGRNRDGDVPMFWACDVTSQAAVIRAAPLFTITREPGHMPSTDARDTDLGSPEQQADRDDCGITAQAHRIG